MDERDRWTSRARIGAWTSIILAAVACNSAIEDVVEPPVTSVTLSSDSSGVAQVLIDGLVDTIPAGNNPSVAVGSVVTAPSPGSVGVGGTVQFTATVYDAQGNVLTGKPVTWRTDNTGIATVSSSGLVRGEAAGTTNVRATSEGRTGFSQLTVGGASVATVTVTPNAVSLVVGYTRQLSATAFDAQGNAVTGRTVTWTSTNTAVATVSSGGRVRAQGAGTASVRATVDGKVGTSQITVTTTAPAPVASVTVAPATASVVRGNTVQLSATLRDAQGNVLTGRSVTWSSDNAVIASVSGSGLARGEAVGSTTIRATSEGRTGASQITVTAAAPAPVATVTVSPSPASVASGGTLQLSATLRDAQGNVLTGRTVTWSSDNSAVASVNSSGMVQGGTPGATTVRATSEGQSGSSQVTVTGGGGGGGGSGGGANYALRFYANVLNDVGRVKIPLENRPVNIGAGNFTIEFWVRGRLQDNTKGMAQCGLFSDGWIEGNILLDRDRFSKPRDYGLSFLAGRVAFGIRTAQDQAYTLCGSRNVLDDQWHHVAVTRNVSTGAMAIFIDGFSDAAANGPTGDVSYPAGFGCSGGCGADPFLVIGAEKHDVGSQYPGFNGDVDELRLSTTIRYSGSFARPLTRFAVDASTAALYHFDEGSGNLAGDAVGSSPGDVRVGGSPGGPAWVSSTAPTN